MQIMDFWFFWKIFRKKWRIIFLVAFMVGIASGVFSKLFIHPVYRSSVSLYLGRVTETSPMEKIMAQTGEVGEATSQLRLGSELTDDYRELVNFDVITEGVSDELAKSGKWIEKTYEVSAEQIRRSRILKINIDSEDPIFSQEVANIYAREFSNKIQKLIGVQNVQIIEEPALQLRPISPRVPLNVAIGFILGFALAFGSYVIIRILDRTIHTSRDVENTIKIPVVGTVHQDREYSVDPHNPLLFDGEEQAEKNRTQIAEDFRVFRVNLINRKKETEKNGQNSGSVIAVTSSQAKEGKTFCTANLGASLAEAGYKVLLIDCDTGDRGLQSYFGTADEKGLMNILCDETDFEHTVKRNLNNLKMDVLFCGDQKVNSANLMISPKFKELVDKLKHQYDYAFLDVSCHLGAADIVSAGSNADSVLLLVHAGKTDGDTAKQAVAAIKRANLDISGVILNGIDEE